MRRVVGFLSALTVAAAGLAMAAPAHAAGTGALTQAGGGTTVEVTWNGLGGAPTGNVLFCPTSVAAASCNFVNYTYLLGGFGVPLPSSGTFLGVGTNVYSRASSSITTLPDGTFNMNFLDDVQVSIATLSNAVIGTGVSPSNDSSGAPSGSGPAPIVQQFGRPASGTCEALASADLNWGGAESGGWSESWAEWMNGGRGGAVCTRTLAYRSSTGMWSAA